MNMKKSILLLCVLTALARGQSNTLPKPSGVYLIGIAYLSLTDESRKELFDNSGQGYREITIKAWYPTDKTSNPEPYLSDADFAIKYCMFPEKFRDLKTNSGRDLPVSSGEKNTRRSGSPQTSGDGKFHLPHWGSALSFGSPSKPQDPTPWIP
jgi:hypothetical protein